MEDLAAVTDFIIMYTQSLNSCESRCEYITEQNCYASSGNAPFITETSSNDVLCGRGSKANEYEGNKRFRSLVAERKTDYIATDSNIAKTKIAQDIINIISRASGRFLVRIEATSIRTTIKAWTVASDKTTLEKVKQALRQQKKKNRITSTQQLPITARNIPILGKNQRNSNSVVNNLDHNLTSKYARNVANVNVSCASLSERTRCEKEALNTLLGKKYTFPTHVSSFAAQTRSETQVRVDQEGIFDDAEEDADFVPNFGNTHWIL